jgi:hypothetical protein
VSSCCLVVPFFFRLPPINIPIFYDVQHRVLHGMFLLKTQDGKIEVLGYTARSGYSLLTLRQLAVLLCLDQKCDSFSFPIRSLLIFRMSSAIMYGIAAETFSVYSSDGSLIRWRTHPSAIFAPEFTSVVDSASVVNHLGQQYVIVLHFSPQALMERLTVDTCISSFSFDGNSFIATSDNCGAMTCSSQ